MLSAMCRRRKRPAETWQDYWRTRLRHARSMLLSSCRPPLVQLTLYKQWCLAKHVVFTVYGEPVKSETEFEGTLMEPEKVEIDILRGTPAVQSSTSFGCPEPNRRRRTTEYRRDVQRRREGAPGPRNPLCLNLLRNVFVGISRELLGQRLLCKAVYACCTRRGIGRTTGIPLAALWVLRKRRSSRELDVGHYGGAPAMAFGF